MGDYRFLYLVWPIFNIVQSDFLNSMNGTPPIILLFLVPEIAQIESFIKLILNGLFNFTGSPYLEINIVSATLMAVCSSFKQKLLWLTSLLSFLYDLTYEIWMQEDIRIIKQNTIFDKLILYIRLYLFLFLFVSTLRK